MLLIIKEYEIFHPVQIRKNSPTAITPRTHKGLNKLKKGRFTHDYSPILDTENSHEKLQALIVTKLTRTSAS